MKQLISFLSVFLLLSAARPSAAATVLPDHEAEALIERIALSNRRYESIVCRFQQTRHVSVLSHDVISRGRYYYRHDGYMCMLYSLPEGNVMLMNPDVLLIVEDGRRSALQKDSTPFAKQMRKMLTACMSGDIAHLGLSSKSRISASVHDGFYQVSVESGRNSYVLEFNSSDLTLRKLVFSNINGDFTEYSFSDVVIDQPISPEIFDAANY